MFSSLLLAAATATLLAEPEVCEPTIKSVFAEPIAPPASAAPTAGRHWTIRDIVEVKRIQGVAIQGASKITAYILKEPSLATGRNRYSLFVIDGGKRTPPRKIAESDYMSDLSWRPNTDHWTVRADYGDGVQVYDFDHAGTRIPVVINHQTTVVGGNDGLIPGYAEARATGVISYGWSPDGQRLWYNRPGFVNEGAQKKLLDGGVVYDPSVMYSLSAISISAATTIASIDLRVFDLKTNEDHVVTSIPTGARNLFGGSNGAVSWADATHLQFRTGQMKAGHIDWALWRVNIDNRVRAQIQTVSLEDAYYSTPTPLGYITVRNDGIKNELLEISTSGRPIRDYGKVAGSRLSGGAFWRSSNGDHFIFGVNYPDRDGLASIPGGLLKKAVSDLPDDLAGCAFNTDLSFGVCDEESFNSAPRLVAITTLSGKVHTLVNPNVDYLNIAPLISQKLDWVNKYCSENDGYIVYPRSYVSGHSYPAIIVSHSHDARNWFARQEFQWDFPLQVFAERGYFVLEVNQPKGYDGSYFADVAASSVENVQFGQFLNPAASMEAAVMPFIKLGMIDPSSIGIAGYSAGAELAYFAIGHSSLYRAASFGDDSGFTPSQYWWGPTQRSWLTRLYGGSPFDVKFLENYRKYSTSFRLDHVKAPLLQQYGGSIGAGWGLEFDQLLASVDIPHELVEYPMEAHLFNEPRHRSTAMERNLDWFDYWLRGIKNESEEKTGQYRRWDALASAWKLRINGGGN